MVSCYLCNRKTSGTENISLHRFPKKLDIRKKWLNACGLTTNDDVRRTCICSRHFRPEDICRSNIFGRVKSSIRRYAVPTLHLTNPLIIGESIISPSRIPLSESFNDNEVDNKSSSFIPDNNIVDESNAIYCMEKGPEKYIELNIIKVQEPNNSSTEADLVESDEKSNSNLRIENRMAGSSREGKNTVLDEHNYQSQCRKRRFFEPRYVGEISSLDFATPKRAERTIQLIKITDKKKSEKIKQLQKQTKHLLKRVQSLQDIIKHLKETRVSTDKSGDASTVMYILTKFCKYNIVYIFKPYNDDEFN